MSAYIFVFVLSICCFSSYAQNSNKNLKFGRISMDPNKSIVENTENSGNHKVLLAAINATDLADILDKDGPFTVFAPSDLAFNKFTSSEMAVLLKPENKHKLRSLLTYHIVAGNFTASKLLRAMSRGKGTTTLTTVQGNKITATMNGIDIVLTDSYGNTARITTADANQCNGVIHVIDSVILPQKYNLL
ncbi:fasciclin domain-containing protein [Flavobacteriaceae bacterium KMM 6897]|nr:fasciclin domain-containing protein [Flavobacteriaceae bacterium KMM 6897]MEB8345647.1 fasciclin domain-containing protein [Flavobacteriaceae bacterium KMM 6898]